MRVRLISVAAMVLATMGATSAFAKPGSTKIDGQDVNEYRAEDKFTSMRTRAEVQDEAIKAVQDGTLAVNISKLSTVDGQLVGAVGTTTSADVGSDSITRGVVKDELMAGRVKPTGMPEKVFDYL